LIPSGFLRLAVWTSSFDKSIGQKSVTPIAEQLIKTLLLNEPILIAVQKYLLDDFFMLLSGGSSKEVKIDIEVLVDLLMDLVILITNLLRRALFLQSLGFSSSSILISTADVYRVVAHQSTVSRIHIGRKYSSDQVAQMWLVVDIR
jgi:hypothetical protein